MFASPFSIVVSLIFQISVDVVGLVDEWAARFFEELDYINEGENGKLFAEMMRKDLPQVSTVIINHVWSKFMLIYRWSNYIRNIDSLIV